MGDEISEKEDIRRREIEILTTLHHRFGSSSGFLSQTMNSTRMKTLVAISLFLCICSLYSVDCLCKLSTTSVGNCRRICAYERRCEAYTWYKKGGCSLKKTKGWKVRPCTGCQSGFFQNGKLHTQKDINYSGGDLSC